jgi:phosphoribosylamine--glycine ligase
VTPARILVAGGGAREHALAWRLARDTGVEAVHVAPGNAGMADVATIHPAVTASDVEAVCRLALDIGAELVVVGPEAPLAAGLVDRLSAAGVLAFGPTRAAAALETSKAFCRQLAESVGIPMAEGASFSDVDRAIGYARALAGPLAVKADGLAGGKGVTLCATLAEAEAAIRSTGPKVIVERLLTGREASLMAICDGERALALPVARDYKRAGDGDSGANTGGMGAYSPLEDLDQQAAARLLDVFCRPALAEMARRGTPFRGVLYAGLLLADDGPRLLEFNARFGDPEAEVILPRLAGNLAATLAAAAAGGLAQAELEMTSEAAAAVVLAASGYPRAARSGDLIEGIAAAEASGALVFHGATARSDGLTYTSGGRVLTVVGRGTSIGAARERAYAAAAQIRFAGMHFRSDIAGAPLAVAGA